VKRLPYIAVWLVTTLDALTLLAAPGALGITPLPAGARGMPGSTLSPASLAPASPFAAAGAAVTPRAPAHIHPAVARIVAPGNGSISYGSGTLVYCDAQYGVVITNWHVVNELSGNLSVHFPDGFYSLGTILRADRDWDLAAILIRRPHVEPVPIAPEAPRPGEVLTIAGYGAGSYRAASGRCTQYVAPGTTFPYEMVEVAVTARQGDSGGPIFNMRGELAGVLFGEGQGRTSGSYCGRVRWFLSAVVPSNTASQQMIAQTPATNAAPEPSRAPAATVAPQGGLAQAFVPPQVQTSAIPLAERAPMPGAAGATMTLSAPAAPAVEPNLVASTRSAPEVPSDLLDNAFGWEDFAGYTWGDQLKTVFAGIGILGLLLHVLRWLSREPTASK